MKKLFKSFKLNFVAIVCLLLFTLLNCDNDTPTAVSDVYPQGNPDCDEPCVYKGEIPSQGSYMYIEVHDLFGSIVLDRFDMVDVQTSTKLYWNGTDKYGKEVPTGIYILKAAIYNDGKYWRSACNYLPVTQNDSVPPGKPENLIATPSDGYYTLKWNPVKNAYGYRIYCTDATTPAKTDSFDCNYIEDEIYQLIYDHTYSFSVRAINGAGVSVPSETITVKMPLFAPKAPHLIDCVGDNGYVALNWNSVTNSQYYNIYYSKDSNFTNQNKRYSTGRYIRIDSLVNGMTYYFRLTACNSIGESGYSNYAKAIPHLPNPSNLQIKQVDGFINLLWNSVPGAQSYTVRVDTGTTISPILYSLLNCTDTTFKFQCPRINRELLFSVCAKDSISTSMYSSSVSTKPAFLDNFQITDYPDSLVINATIFPESGYFKLLYNNDTSITDSTAIILSYDVNSSLNRRFVIKNLSTKPDYTFLVKFENTYPVFYSDPIHYVRKNNYLRPSQTICDSGYSKIYWNKLPDVKKYIISLRTWPETPWPAEDSIPPDCSDYPSCIEKYCETIEVPGADTTYIFKNLRFCKIYYAAISAEYEDGTKAGMSPFMFIDSKRATPENRKSSFVNDTIILTWDASVNDGTKYFITCFNSTANTTVFTNEPATSPFIYTGALKNNTYVFQLSMNCYGDEPSAQRIQFPAITIPNN